MGVVRASSLQLAEKCDLAPYLSETFREGNAAARFGSDVDHQVSEALKSGVLVVLDGQSILPEVQGILDWVARTFPASAEFYIQRHLSLRDPETGEELSRGTPDLLVVMREQRRIVVVDWKKMGQWWAGHLAPPGDNLQQLTYLTAATMEFSLQTPIDSGQIILACFDEHGVSPKESKEIPVSELWDVIKRVKAIPRIDVSGPQPEASKGDHCSSCYRRMHCHAYLLPAMRDVPVALVPFVQSEAGQVELTNETALAALDWVDKAKGALKTAKELVDLVEGNVEAFTMRNGPIIRGDEQFGPFEKTGRKLGPTVGDLEATKDPELIKLIRPGKVSIDYGWKPLSYRMHPPGEPAPKEEKKPRAKKEAAPKLTRKQPAQIEAVTTEGK